MRTRHGGSAICNRYKCVSWSRLKLIPASVEQIIPDLEFTVNDNLTLDIARSRQIYPTTCTNENARRFAPAGFDSHFVCIDKTAQPI
jgi:hypothetical protein